MTKTPEGIIQTYAQEQLKKRGCLVRKISYEGRRGCPDLLVLVPEFPFRSIVVGPRTMFLEIKKDEQKKPDPHQQREHERIRQHGGDVRVIGSKEQIDSLLSELFPCD
ncbi:VRR-NUC domain-containing protein [Salmonella enterica]